jgi:hypothetical protein
LPTDAGRRRDLRDSALGKAVLLLGVLAVAFLATRGCASRETEVSKEQAVEIAREEIDYEPERVMTKFVARGIQSRPSWAVSLATLRDDGSFERVTVVVVDGRTGDVVEIKQG